MSRGVRKKENNSLVIFTKLNALQRVRVARGRHGILNFVKLRRADCNRGAADSSYNIFRN